MVKRECPRSKYPLGIYRLLEQVEVSVTVERPGTIPPYCTELPEWMIQTLRFRGNRLGTQFIPENNWKCRKFNSWELNWVCKVLLK